MAVGGPDAEAPGDGDGLIEPGEKVAVTVDIVDGQGAAVPLTDIARMEVVMSGPMENPNTVYVTAFNSNPSRGDPAPTAILGATGPSHTFMLPERIQLEGLLVVSGPPVVVPTECNLGLRQIGVDLERGVVTGPDGENQPFEIDPFSRHCLLEGLDPLGYLLEQRGSITRFEQAGGGASIDTKWAAERAGSDRNVEMEVAS